MIDQLFRNQADWVVAKPIPALLKIANQAGLTQQQFDLSPALVASSH
jgi:hypothetical protein